jgi:deazaflavin-dependent oxidoreductase (nitroreductase family)
MTTGPAKDRRLPPRWFIRAFWAGHRALVRVTGGRLGLQRPRPDRWGSLRLHTVGRRSGQERVAILAYMEDGSDLVLIAMNGWDPADPAWWLNLQAHPEASVDLPGGRREVVAREAQGEERARLWERWSAVGTDLDRYARRRASTPVVVLEPR